MDHENDFLITYNQPKKASLALDGDCLIGICEYEETSLGVWDIFHTEVSKENGGRGIAKRLVLTLLAEARKQGKKIQPSCSYARKVMEENEEFKDLLIG